VNTGRQRGVSIISAILLIVLLTGLGAVIVAVGQVQSAAAGLDVAGSRAGHAAQAGIEWGKYQVLIPAAPVCPAAFPLAGLPGSLAPYTVTVTCAVSGPYTEGAATLSRYTITATACNQPAAGACPNPAPAPGPSYVERQLTAQVER